MKDCWVHHRHPQEGNSLPLAFPDLQMANDTWYRDLPFYSQPPHIATPLTLVHLSMSNLTCCYTASPKPFQPNTSIFAKPTNNAETLHKLRQLYYRSWWSSNTRLYRPHFYTPPYFEIPPVLLRDLHLRLLLPGM